MEELGWDEIVLEQRGSLLTRLGTLIGYSSSAMAIAIVKVPPLLKPQQFALTYNMLDVYLQDAKDSRTHFYNEYLEAICSYYRKQAKQLSEITNTIFKTKFQFTNGDLCEAFGGNTCNRYKEENKWQAWLQWEWRQLHWTWPKIHNRTSN